MVETVLVVVLLFLDLNDELIFVYSIKYKVITCIVIQGAATQDMYIFAGFCGFTFSNLNEGERRRDAEKNLFMVHRAS